MSLIWSFVKPLVESAGMVDLLKDPPVEEIRSVSPPVNEGRRFVCVECDCVIHNNRPLFFLWDRTFCSSVCRMNHLETKAPPDLTAQYNELVVPRGWTQPPPPPPSTVKLEDEAISSRKRREPSVHAGSFFFPIGF